MKPRAVMTLVVAILAAAPASPATAQSPTPFFSVNVGSVFNPDGTLRGNGEAQLRALQATGLSAARVDASRAVVEPLPGMRDFSVLDRIATALAGHGLRWLPTLGYAPLWERPVAGTDKTPPASDAAFASYAAAVAARYGPGGTFWSAHPELPALAIPSVEVWNEPNLPAYWRTGPDPARYASLYLATRNAVHAAAPGVQVVTGGLSPYADPAAFLRGMLAAEPRLKTDIDAVGFHPYASSAPVAVDQVAGLRAAMRTTGLASTSIVITEIGWPLPNQSPNHAFALPDATRGTAVDLAARALTGGTCGVSGMTLFTWTSPMRNPAEQEDWFGVARPDASLTAAAQRYVAVAAAPPTTGSLTTCDKGSGAPLRLDLRVSKRERNRRLCITASVTDRGAPASGIPIAYFGARSKRRPRTDDAGRVTSCLSGVTSVRVQARAGAWAVSRSVTVRR